jgi:cytoskeletal protein CcmA (bactofilin family)
VTGDVRCALLSQGEGGAVAGNIVADEARLAGLVDGTVEAGTLALQSTARISGDILYEALSIASGAQVEGRFKRRRSGADGSGSARVEAVSVASLDPPAKPQPPELFGSLANLHEAEAAE